MGDTTQYRNGTVVRYTETERKTGRWVNRGTVERVRWRAIPFDLKLPITYHNRKRDAVAALNAEPAQRA